MEMEGGAVMQPTTPWVKLDLHYLPEDGARHHGGW